MNAMKNLAHLIVLGVLAVAGVLFSLKVLFAGGLVAALLFWAWFGGFPAVTSFLADKFKSPIGALLSHGGVILFVSLMPKVMPFSVLRLGIDLLG